MTVHYYYLLSLVICGYSVDEVGNVPPLGPAFLKKLACRLSYNHPQTDVVV